MAGETQELVDFVTDLSPADVPASVVQRAKVHLLDAVASGFLGTGAPWAEMLLATVDPRPTGAPGASVFGEVSRYRPQDAAYVTGGQISALEAEHFGHSAHPSACVVPAALAVAETAGASGWDLLLAIIAGYEVVCRVGAAQTRAVEDERGFHNPGVNGPFGAAAAAGRLLGLSREGMANAFGIAGSHSAGLMEFVADGTMTKRLHLAAASRAGVDSAHLASLGYTGPRTVLEGAHGYMHAFSPRPNMELLTADLGERWLGTETTIKPYPCHGTSQGLVSAVHAYRDAHGLEPDDVVGVSVSAPSSARFLQKRFQDVRPETPLAAQLSAPFLLALSIDRDIRFANSFHASSFENESIRMLAADIVWNPQSESETRTVISIRFADTTVDIDASGFEGSVGSDVTLPAIAEKVARYGSSHLSAPDAARVAELVEAIESLADLTEFFDLMRRPVEGRD